MWRTCKTIKKILLYTFKNIYDKVFNIKELTFGIPWSSVFLIAGNNRFITKEGQIGFECNYSEKNNIVSLNVSNNKFLTKKKIIDLKNIASYECPPFEDCGWVFKTYNIPTPTNNDILIDMVFWYYEEDVNMGSGGTYSVLTFDISVITDYGTEYLIKTIKEEDWIGDYLEYDSVGGGFWADFSTVSQASIKITRQEISKFIGENEKVEEIYIHNIQFPKYPYHFFHKGDGKLIVSYIDKYGEPIRTATNIDLLAVEL